VVAERVDPVNGLLERDITPRALAKLVGIVVDEPVGAECGRQLGLPSNDLSQPELTRGFQRTQTFDADHAAADIWFHGLNRAVGGAIVEKVDGNVLVDQITYGSADDVSFVVGGDDRNNREPSGHRRAL